MIGPVTFGALVDRTGSHTVGWSVVVVLCLLAIAFLLAWVRSSRSA